MNRFALAVGAILALACGDDDRTDDGPSPDAGALDATVLDATLPDAGGDDLGLPFPDCSALTLDETFVVAPGLPSVTIQPSAVFDGDGLWVTVTTVEEGTSGFDVYLVRMGCDGRTGEPILVSETSLRSDIDAAVAVGPNALVVAWQADPGTGTVETWVRLHDLETGAPLAPAREIRTTRGGAPHVGTVWSPTLVAGDPVTLVGERGVEEASAFQAYAQPLDESGAAAGETLEPLFEPMVGQDGAVGVRTAAGLTLAWTRQPAEGATSVVIDTPDAEPSTVPSGSIEASSPSLAVFGDSTWLAMSAGGGQRAIEMIAVGSDAFTSLRQPGATDVAPALSAGSTGLGLAWMRVVSGFRGDLFVRRVDVEGTVSASTPVEIPTFGDLFAYPIELIHVGDDVFFVLWVEGESNANLRSVGRFVQL